MAEDKIRAILKGIKALVLDVDGVLTDGSLLLMPDGEQLRTMNIRDGYAMKHLADSKFPLTIISAGQPSQGVDARLRKLGIHDFRLGVHDKCEAFEDFVQSYHLQYHEVAYMGDDMPDYECMVKAGFAACPSDAAAEIRAISHWTSSYPGGRGCVRELIELILKAQDKHWGSAL